MNELIYFAFAAGIDFAAAPTSFIDFVPAVSKIVAVTVVDADVR